MTTELREALDRARNALPDFKQQDDYLLAYGASLMSEESHEIISIDTLEKIVRAALAAAPQEPVEYLVEAEWPDRFGVPLEVMYVLNLRNGKVGIRVKPHGQREAILAQPAPQAAPPKGYCSKGGEYCAGSCGTPNICCDNYTEASPQAAPVLAYLRIPHDDPMGPLPKELAFPEKRVPRPDFYSAEIPLVAQPSPQATPQEPKKLTRCPICKGERKTTEVVSFVDGPKYVLKSCHFCGATGSILVTDEELGARASPQAAQQEPSACGYDETTGQCTKNPCCYSDEPSPQAAQQEPTILASLDWERLRSGDRRALDPENQWAFDALKASPQAAQQEPDMLAVCNALGFDPTNHHNAAVCPYCDPHRDTARPSPQATRVSVSLSRIAALSRALGNPPVVAALEGDTIEDALVELAVNRLTAPQAAQGWKLELLKAKELADKSSKIDRRHVYGSVVAKHFDAMIAAPPQAAPTTQEPLTKGDLDFAKMLLSEVARSGNPGAIRLAAQLAGVQPCEACGYMHLHCRCAPAQPSPQAAPKGEPK